MSKDRDFEIFEEFEYKLFNPSSEYGHIYILYDENERAIYIGQSKNIFNRVAYHFCQKKIPLSRVKCFKVKTEDLKKAEIFFIKKEDPYLNVTNGTSIGLGKGSCLILERKYISKITMSLKDYLVTNEITISDFCKKVGYNRCYIQSYLGGSVRLGNKCAYAIENETKGVVPREITLNDNPPKKIPKDFTIPIITMSSENATKHRLLELQKELRKTIRDMKPMRKKVAKN